MGSREQLNWFEESSFAKTSENKPSFVKASEGKEGKEMTSPEKRGIAIPQEELEIEFARSGGRGGQNVNKVETKVRVRWNLDESDVLSEEEKERIRKVYPNRITEKGELLVESQKFRTQAQNRARAIERLHELVENALIPEKERKPIKLSRSQREKRLREKRIQTEKKRLRRKVEF